MGSATRNCAITIASGVNKQTQCAERPGAPEHDRDDESDDDRWQPHPGVDHHLERVAPREPSNGERGAEGDAACSSQTCGDRRDSQRQHRHPGQLGVGAQNQERRQAQALPDQIHAR